MRVQDLERGLAHRLKICRRQIYARRMAVIIPQFKPGRAARVKASEVLVAPERTRTGQ